MWQLYNTKQGQKNARNLGLSGLKSKAQELLAIIQADPFQNPPLHEKRGGDFSGAYFRRINIQRRLVYEVLEQGKSIKVLRL